MFFSGEIPVPMSSVQCSLPARDWRQDPRMLMARCPVIVRTPRPVASRHTASPPAAAASPPAAMASPPAAMASPTAAMDFYPAATDSYPAVPDSFPAATTLSNGPAAASQTDDTASPPPAVTALSRSSVTALSRSAVTAPSHSAVIR